MSETVSNIIAKYNDIIEKTVSLYKVRARQYGLDLDDFRQICRITIWRCLKDKPESSAEFVPYIRTSMRKALRGYITKTVTGRTRQAAEKAHDYKFPQTSQLLFKPGSYEDLIGKISSANKEDDLDYVKSFILLCTKKDPDFKTILEMRMDGYTHDDIMKLIRMPRMSYYRKIDKLKNLYREFSTEDEYNDASTAKPNPKTSRRRR